MQNDTPRSAPETGRSMGRAVLISILATGALVALNPQVVDYAPTDAPGVLDMTEIA